MRATLWIFGISHYCEKARWALEHQGLPHDIRLLAPGLHVPAARRLGAPRASVPILVLAEGGFVQGSAAILDHAETQAAPGQSVVPAVPDAAATERRLDRGLGVQVRRLYYSEALVDHPRTVRPLFTAGLPAGQRLVLRLVWPLLRLAMIRGMDLGRAQYDDARARVAAELDWLDSLLADGRRYLDGRGFSRLDIAAASLLAPLVLPPEHPTYGSLAHPPRLAADCRDWAGRPSLAHVRRIHADHRRARPRGRPEQTTGGST